MSTLEDDIERRWSTKEVTQLTGASFRMVDYWDRFGRLGPKRGTGSGNPRRFELAEVVLIRAYVLTSPIAQIGWAERAKDFYRDYLREFDKDASLQGLRLVVEADKAYIARSTSAPAALVVNLATCARDVSARMIALRWAPSAIPLADQD